MNLSPGVVAEVGMLEATTWMTSLRLSLEWERMRGSILKVLLGPGGEVLG